MNDDYLINLLPSEYLPKPEFKLFPIFVIVLIGLTAAYLWLDNTRIMSRIADLNGQKTSLTSQVESKSKSAQEALYIQASSRMLFSYGVSVWSTLHQSPPWVEVYNEIEESIPEGMWIQSLKIVGGGEKKWPNFTMVGLVAGNRPETVLAMYEKMLEPESKFDKVSITGYTFVKYKGRDAVTFNMRFSLKKVKFVGFKPEQ